MSDGPCISVRLMQKSAPRHENGNKVFINVVRSQTAACITTWLKPLWNGTEQNNTKCRTVMRQAKPSEKTNKSTPNSEVADSKNACQSRAREY